jgi:DNA-binding NarL/FixJ family response regulator
MTSSRKPEAEAAPAPRAPIRTLAVDDSPHVLTHLRNYLRHQPRFQLVGTASSGEEAVSQTANLRPDLIIMDVQMPGMNGLTATRLIKQNREAPFILVSTFDDNPAVAAAAAKAGCDLFCAKDKLIDALEQLAADWTSGSEGRSTDAP